MTDPRLAIFILLFSAAVLILISVISWMRRSKVGSPAIFLSLCMASAAVYNFGYAMEISRSTLPEIMFWVRFQHWGIQALSPTWLLFALHISGREKLVRNKRMVMLFIVPVFLFITAQTLGGLNLFHINPRLDPSAPFPAFIYDRGTAAWLGVTFNTFCIAASTVLFIMMLTGSGSAFQGQATLFLIGSLIPWAVMILYMFGITPLHLDPTPFAFSLSGLVFSLGLFSFRFLDIIPLARDIIFNGMSEGVLALDLSGRIVDFNPCLERMIPEVGKSSLGSHASEILTSYPDLAEKIKVDHDDAFEIRVCHNGEESSYKCRISTLVGWRKDPVGKIIIFSDFTQVRHLLQELERLAAIDDLTGVYNRRHFSELAAREVYRFRRYGGAISLIMLDLDHFKKINDTFGHAAGDAVLAAAAKTFCGLLRKTDILGRFGGEEFIVLLPETTPTAAVKIAEKMRLALADLSTSFQDHSFVVTASFGVTGVVSPDIVELKDLFERADRALYKAKERGRDQVFVDQEDPVSGHS